MENISSQIHKSPNVKLNTKNSYLNTFSAGLYNFQTNPSHEINWGYETGTHSELDLEAALWIGFIFLVILCSILSVYCIFKQQTEDFKSPIGAESACLGNDKETLLDTVPRVKINKNNVVEDQSTVLKHNFSVNIIELSPFGVLQGDCDTAKEANDMSKCNIKRVVLCLEQDCMKQMKTIKAEIPKKNFPDICLEVGN